MSDNTKLSTIGGFLGVGKTELIIQLSKKFVMDSKRVAIVTNDQGEVLVDTQTVKDLGLAYGEVLKGCFCCRFPQFIVSLHEILKEVEPDIILAEPVGSCTDLIATVYAPLRDYYGNELALSPYIVLADAFTIRELDKPKTNQGYLMSWQIEEAEVIGLNKTDLVSSERIKKVTNVLRKINKNARIIPISAKTGYNIDEITRIIVHEKHQQSTSIDVNYEIYGNAEAELGWFNGGWTIKSEYPFNPEEFVHELCTAISTFITEKKGQIYHLKVHISGTTGSMKASLVSTEQGIQFTGRPLSDEKCVGMIINIRAKLEPKTVIKCVRESVKSIVYKYRATHTEWHAESFKPRFPTPYYRFVCK